MAVTRFALWALVALSVCYGFTAAIAQEPEIPQAPEAEKPPVRDSLAERMFVPKAGRMEVAYSPSINVSMKLDDLDDVMALYRDLDQGELDEESIRSWRFLDRAGLRRVPQGQLYIIEGDRRVPVENPESQPVARPAQVIEFKPGYYTQRPLPGGIGKRLVQGPRSHVEIREAFGVVQQLNHSAADEVTRMRHRLLDPWHLLSRDADRLTQAGLREHLDQGQLYEIKHGAAEILWLDQRTDAIYARISTWQDKPIQRFQLHLGMQKFDQPTPHQLPRMTLIFQRQADYWTVKGYEIRHLDFSKVPAAETFQVPLTPDITYVTSPRGGGTRSAQGIPDIVPFTPGEIVAMLRRGK